MVSSDQLQVTAGRSGWEMPTASKAFRTSHIDQRGVSCVFCSLLLCVEYKTVASLRNENGLLTRFYSLQNWYAAKIRKPLKPSLPRNICTEETQSWSVY